LLDAWHLVARRYRGGNMVGFDFPNESLDLQSVAFEHDSLYSFYRNAIDTLRRVGARQ
jgi:hypothetical protein